MLGKEKWKGKYKILMASIKEKQKGYSVSKVKYSARKKEA